MRAYKASHLQGVVQGTPQFDAVEVLFLTNPILPNSKDLADTKVALEHLQSPFDEGHWYWGAFLRSTGELIGEGGLFDTEG